MLHIICSISYGFEPGIQPLHMICPTLFVWSFNRIRRYKILQFYLHHHAIKILSFFVFAKVINAINAIISLFSNIRSSPNWIIFNVTEYITGCWFVLTFTAHVFIPEDILKPFAIIISPCTIENISSFFSLDPSCSENRFLLLGAYILEFPTNLSGALNEAYLRLVRSDQATRSSAELTNGRVAFGLSSVHPSFAML